MNSDKNDIFNINLCNVYNKIHLICEKFRMNDDYDISGSLHFKDLGIYSDEDYNILIKDGKPRLMLSLSEPFDENRLNNEKDYIVRGFLSFSCSEKKFVFYFREDFPFSVNNKNYSPGDFDFILDQISIWIENRNQISLSENGVSSDALFKI